MADQPSDQPSASDTSSGTSASAATNHRLLTGQSKYADDFARLNHERFAYVHGLGWHHWTDCRWQRSLAEQHRHAFKDFIAKKLYFSAQMGDKSEVGELNKMMSNQAQTGSLTISRSDPLLAVTVEELDSDPHIINTPHGMVDLIHLSTRAAVPADRVTKLTGGSYVPDVDQSFWLSFLNQILPDEDVRTYVQKFVGLSLLGEVRENILGIGTGTGANGKSVFYNAVLHALGDYGHAAEADLFMATRGTHANAPKPAIFALMGKRFVVCSETEEGVRLASALMKQLTGGDPITARTLNSEPVTFLPSWTALMVTNHLPQVAANDDALWRRIRIIPFSVVIPKDQRDTALTTKLRDHADAILTWAIEGLQQYIADGYQMNEPAAVLHATQNYRSESDDYARFFKESVDFTGDPKDKVLQSDLWSAWEQFVKDGGARTPGKPQDFYTELEKHGGIRGARYRRARAFAGVLLTESDDTTEDEDQILDLAAD